MLSLLSKPLLQVSSWKEILDGQQNCISDVGKESSASDICDHRTTYFDIICEIDPASIICYIVNDDGHMGYWASVQ